MVAALLMVGGWFMLKQTGSEFMPRAEAREFYVDLQMPEGTQLERTSGCGTQPGRHHPGDSQVMNLN